MPGVFQHWRVERRFAGFGSNQPMRINVQMPASQSTLTSVTDPVDLKWDGTHLYVLSGSGAAIYEFATNGGTIRSLGGLGSNPSGFDVDGAGNVYVAVKGGNQSGNSSRQMTRSRLTRTLALAAALARRTARREPTPASSTRRMTWRCRRMAERFRYRIRGITGFSNFRRQMARSLPLSVQPGQRLGQFNTPKGLTYDSCGTLYIVDSGNNRVVLAQGIR